jgi:hypothetical protein
MNKKNFTYTFLVFCLLSPGLSFSYFLIGIYIPNHFIAYPILAFLLLYQMLLKKENLRKRNTFIILIWIFAYVTAVIFRLCFVGTSDFYSSDISLLILSVSIFVAIALKKLNPSKLVRSLRVVVFLHCVWALIQNLLLNFGIAPTLGIFLTHPDQIAGLYYFPQWIGPFYRVSGFMLEASQFSFLVAFYLIWSFSNKTLTWKDIFPLITVLINGSSTGYLLLGSIFMLILIRNLANALLRLRLNLKMLVIPIFTIVILVVMIPKAQDQIEKINGLIQFISNNGSTINFERIVRLSMLIEEIKSVSGFSEVFWGRGLVSDQGWDLYSVSIKGLGLFLFLLFQLVLIFFLRKNFYFFILSLALFGVSNGSVLESCTLFIIFLLGITYVCSPKKQDGHSNSMPQFRARFGTDIRKS